MRKFGLRRALSTRPVARQQDPVFIQEDIDEHGNVVAVRSKPARNNSLLGRVFRKKVKSQPSDLSTANLTSVPTFLNRAGTVKIFTHWIHGTLQLFMYVPLGRVISSVIQ